MPASLDDTPFDEQSLHDRVVAVVPGRWAVGVSGGADSVALLLLLADRPDLHPHVAHLDHQTRGGESGEDAAFVVDLCRRLKIPFTVARRDEIEAGGERLPNRSAQFRRSRHELFRKVVATESLRGVLLAHHAGDQAETILLRMLRSGGADGMETSILVDGLLILRPLLNTAPGELRRFLAGRRQTWREDSSNVSDDYARNRSRSWLRDRPATSSDLLDVADRADRLDEWIVRNAARLDDKFSVNDVDRLPPPLSRRSARNWLVGRGCPPAQVDTKTSDRLIVMATDAASPRRQHFPGSVLVRRAGETIFAESR